MPRPHTLPPVLATTSVLLLALLAPLALADEAIRVVTWNLETVGTPGSAPYQAVAAVLGRIDADVVAIQEVAGATDARNLQTLALQLGYPYVEIAPGGPFGALRNALLSDFPITLSTVWTSALLSGDAKANDLTRFLPEIRVDVTGQGHLLGLVSAHLKSGTDNLDEFRRAAESFRMNQIAAEAVREGIPLIMLGDLNADRGDPPLTPTWFTSVPGTLPAGMVLGADLQALLAGAGLRNDPFAYLTARATLLPARQLDGSLATRKASGRRLDYLLTSPTLTRRGPATQVYDCADEGRPGGLPLSGAPLAAGVCTLAADHLPVFADLIVPTAAVAQTLRINDAARAEGQTGTSPLTFTLTLSPKSAGPVTVRYATANGTAQAGTDYVAASGQVTFTPGQTSKTLPVAVKGDLAREGNEVLFVNLTQATGANLADAQGQGLILNDDGPVLAIGDVTLAEGQSGTRTANFRVTLTPASTGAVTVKYATANGTAQAGSDYVAQSGSLSFAAGQGVRTVSVVVRGDRVKEGNETFFVNLSGAAGATVFDGRGVGTIGEDD